MSVRPDNRAGPLGPGPVRALVPPRRPGIPDLPPGQQPTRGGPPAPAAPAAPTADPLAGLLAAYPHPDSEETLAARAQGMIDPLIAALTEGVNQRATAGAGAIRGYTSQLQKDLAGYADSAKNIYGGEEASQAASDAALADRLQGGGQNLAAGLADRLKGIGNGSDPAVQQAAADVAQTGQGSGNALYGKGSASMADLIARSAGAQDYAAKLPGIAGLSGAQQIGQLEQQAQNQIGQGASDIRAKLPELIASLRSGNDAKASNLANFQADLLKYRQGRTDANTQFQQGRQDTAAQNAEHVREFNVGRSDAANARAADARTRTVLAKMANETSSAKAQQDWNKFLISEQDRAARQQAQIDAAAARQQAGITASGTRATAAAAAKAAAAAARQKAAAAKAGAPAKPTAKDVQTWKGTAATVASNAASGFTDAKGVQHPPISEQAAYDEMRKEGIPDQIARDALKRVYGDRDPGTNPNAAGPPLPPGYGQ